MTARYDHLTVVELYTSIEGNRYNLQRDWERGQPGRLVDLIELTHKAIECEIRGIPLPGRVLVNQLRLDVGKPALRLVRP